MRIDNPSVSGSISFIGGNNNISGNSVNLTGSFSGSVKGTFEGGFTSTATSAISGAFDQASGSFSTRVTSLENFEANIDNTYATDSDVTAVSDRVGTLEGKTLLSSSAQIANDISGSFTQLSSSVASTYLLNTTDTLTGDLTVTGTITAQEFHTEFVSASIIYQSGSTQFGDSGDDAHIFSGSVGINVNSPNSALEVDGNIYLSNNSNFLLFGTASNVDAYIQSDSTQNLYLGSRDTSKLFVSSSGNVGIGTTSAALKVNIIGTSTLPATSGTTQNGGIRIENGSNNGVLDIGASSATGAPGWLQATDKADLSQTYNLLLNPNGGNIGVGTTSPSSSLHIYDSTASRLTVGKYGAPHYTQSGMAYQVIRATGTGTERALLELHSGNQGTKANVQAVGDNNTVYFGSLTNSNASFGNNSDAFFFNTSDKVGLGTTTNYGKLTIKGNGSENTYSGVLRIFNSNTTDSWGGISFPDDGDVTTTSNNYYLIGRGTAISSRILSLHVPTASDYGSGSEPTIGFYSSGTDLLFNVKANTGDAYHKGSVGIGTTSPARKFHVTAPDSNIAVFESDTHGIVFQDDGSRFEIVGYKQTGGTYNDIHLRADVTNTLVLKATSGNVGIGTDSPLAPLHLHTGAAGNGATGSFQDNTALGIESTSDQYIEMLTSGGSNGQMQGILFSDNGRNAFVGYKEYTGQVANTKGEALHLAFYDFSASDSNNGIYFGTSNTPWLGVDTTHMFIKGNGNVGIGTTDPGDKLDVRGNVLVDNGIYFKRGGTDYSTYIRSTNYPSQGYTLTSDRYWVELGSKGGTHIVLNTDGGAGGVLNSYDHFTIWQGAVDGDKLMVVDNVGNGYYAGKLGIGSTSPTQKLDVNGVGIFGGIGSYRASLDGGGAGAYLRYGTTADNDSLGTIGTYSSAMMYETAQSGGHVFSTGAGVSGTERMRIATNGDIKNNTNYKSVGWNWVTTPYHYYVATTSQTSVTVAVNSGFTTNGNSAIPSYAKALYVTYYYHISGYGLGDAGQGDHANDIWGPDAPSTTTSWSFTTSGNYDWGSAVFMHDGDASESGDIAYYGQWFPGAIIPVNANGNIYGLLGHGHSGGTHYHHMYVWGYSI